MNDREGKKKQSDEEEQERAVMTFSFDLPINN